jgi:hypothetical protein
MAKGQKKQKMTEETLRKLDEAFAIDASIEEACYFANIGPTTYYEWVKEMPQLAERFNRLRQRPVLTARQTVNEKMKESYSNAMDYLKRKKKLEFGDSTDITSGGEKIDSITYVTPNGKNTDH